MTQIITPGSQVVFLGTSGLGSNFGLKEAPIKSFEAFYTEPPVVGFHVVGNEEEED